MLTVLKIVVFIAAILIPAFMVWSPSRAMAREIILLGAPKEHGLGWVLANTLQFAAHSIIPAGLPLLCGVLGIGSRIVAGGDVIIVTLLWVAMTAQGAKRSIRLPWWLQGLAIVSYLYVYYVALQLIGVPPLLP